MPVTICRFRGQHIQRCSFENKYEKTQQEFTEKTRDLVESLNQQKKEISRLLEEKRVLSKADRELIVSMLSNVLNGLSDRLPFINQLFMEQMEKTMTKGEFESFIQNSINRIALSALAQQPEELVKNFVSALPDKKQGQEEVSIQISEDEPEEEPGHIMGM